MNEYLWQYVMQIDPFAKPEDVISIDELNQWDLLITFSDNKKVIFDRYTGYHKNIYYKSINDITEEQEKKEFAYRLRSLMGRNWVTQEELAVKINVTQTMISRYVSGKAIPSLVIARKIAKVLGCSLDDFFDRDY